MKKIILFIALISCIYSHAQEQLISASNKFAFQLYHATKSDSNNFFISPFSLSIALAVVNEGAGSTTRQEIDNLLSTRGITDRSNAYAELMQKIMNSQDGQNCLQWPENKDAKNKLLLANSLWVQDNVTIKDDYKKILEEANASSVFDFNANRITQANQKLNQWISDKTSGKINGMTLNPETKVAVINAIYFLGEWQVPFEKKKTKEKTFHTLSKNKVKLDFMNMRSVFQYFENSEIQSVSIPYNCDEFRMIILLPKKILGIISLEDKLSTDYLLKIDSSYSNEVILSLPKFKIESEIFPKENLIALGYTEMFSDRADFRNMSGTPLKIGNIVHKTFIELDEARTEAAAISEIEMVVTSGSGGVPVEPPQPKVFNANHPFVFLIVDNRSKTVLFMGRVVE